MKPGGAFGLNASAATHIDLEREKRSAEQLFAERPWDHGAEADALIAERALLRAGRIEREEELHG